MGRDFTPGTSLSRKKAGAWVLSTFRMLTLMRFVRCRDCFISVDLKDAYFHIPIYGPHREFLRFAIQGKMYKYLVLPFGLSLQVFVKCTKTAVAPLREKGFHMATYKKLAICTAVPNGVHYARGDAYYTSVSINLGKEHFNPSANDHFYWSVPKQWNNAFRASLLAKRAEDFRACLVLFHRGAHLKLRLSWLLARWHQHRLSSSLGVCIYILFKVGWHQSSWTRLAMHTTRW